MGLIARQNTAGDPSLPTETPSGTDGSAWVTECMDGPIRVTRGGAWSYSPAILRSAYRIAVVSFREAGTGFRIARTLTSSPQSNLPR